MSELLVAAYQKYMDSDFWGLTNATQEIKDLMLEYGQDGLHLDGHSRGSMTVGNAMESIIKMPGSQGALNSTTISFFGPAYNVSEADALLSYLQNRSAVGDAGQREAMVLTWQNHIADPVGDSLVRIRRPEGAFLREAVGLRKFWGHWVGLIRHIIVTETGQMHAGNRGVINLTLSLFLSLFVSPAIRRHQQ